MSNYSNTITATSGLTNYWRFEGNGTATTGSYNMTIASGYSTSSAGRDGNGLIADSSSTKTGSYCSVPNTFFNGIYSVELWFKAGQHRSSQQELMRMSNELAFEIGTDGKIYYYYDGSQVVTSGTYDDNNWHHVVVTRDVGRVVTLYVDGVSQGTFTASTNAPGSTNLYFAGSQYTFQAFITGAMDEVALYNTALSSTTVTNHYNAMFSAAYTAQAMTASATAVDPVVKGNTYKFNVTDDTYTSTTDLGTTNNGTNLGLAAGTNNTIWIKVPALSSTDAPQTIDTETLNLKSGSSPYFSGTIDIYSVNGSWSETGLTNSNEPSKTFVRTVSVTASSGAPWVTLNIKDADVGYGIALKTSSSTAIFSSAEGSGSPYVTYTVSPLVVAPLTATATMVAPGVSTVTSPTISALPMTASASMPGGTTGVSDGYTAQPMTASVVFNDAVVAITGDNTQFAEHMDSFVDFAGGHFEGPRTVPADAMTASASLVDASVAVEVGVIINAAPMTAVSRWVKPANVNGAPIVIPESEDPYFNRVFAEVPKIWFRLNETTGTHVDDRMDAFGDLGGTYHNVQIGNSDGPDGRQSVHFDGTGYIEQIEPTGTNTDERTDTFSGTTRTTLEFGFRTSKTDQFIMGGRDDSLTQQGQAFIETAQAQRELYLRGGKISMATWFFPNSLGQAHGPYEFTGFRNLADNNWHHVVVKGYTNWHGEEGVEIWVDGSLEIRRNGTRDDGPYGAGPWNGMPDFIGWRPGTVDGVYTSDLSSSMTYVGDMTEVAFYSHLVSDDAIPRHFYDFMGWNPIGVEPIESFEFMTADNKGKGNQKRALLLNWKPGELYDASISPVAADPNVLPFNGTPAPTGQFAGYKVFIYNIAMRVPGFAWRDPVTDEQTLINLRTDLDIDEYSIIMFSDWPDGPDFDSFSNKQRQAYEQLLADLRWANDKGIGLFVTAPRLAIDLGIVDRVEFCPSMAESASVLAQGNAMGLYDYGSAVEFPWNISASSAMDDTWGGKGSRFNGEPQNTDPNFLANKAFFYGDTHKNDKYRVRALVEGLTDIPSYMTEKAIFQVDQSLWGWQISAFKYLHRENGLQIGDEFFFWGTSMGFTQQWIASVGTTSTTKWAGANATPLAHVKAGLVVTTFGATYWQGKSIVDNPYKDYATTIVLQPGDSLKGRPVGGKIYVNFTEQPSTQADAVVSQVIPSGDTGWPATYNVETTAQREWDWSDTRKTLTVTGTQNSNVTYNVTMPDGSLVAITGSQGGGQTLNMVRSSNLFPTETHPSWQMNRRGLLWLSDSGVTDTEGAATVRVEPMAATGAMAQPAVVAEKSVSVQAEVMLGLAQMPKVAEDQTGDVEVFAFPMTANADFTGFSKVIHAEPMTATAELNEPAEVQGGGEQYVLYLQTTPTVTLFLKEEV